MTDTAFEKFNAYWPFDEDYDALQDMKCSWGLLSFPGSTDSSQSEGPASSFLESANSEQSGHLARYRHSGVPRLTRICDESGTNYDHRVRVLSEIETIMGRDGGKIEDLKTWIQMLGDKETKVDIDRVTRYAICENKYDLVRYLVDHQDAQLKQRDKFGRSAVFYTAACADHPKMLHYITTTVGVKTIWEAVNYHDAFDTTPLDYAAMRPSVANVEYCLFAGARPDHDLLAHQSHEGSIGNPGDFFGEHEQIRLLFTLYDRLRSYGNLPVLLENFNRLTSFLPIGQLHAYLLRLLRNKDAGGVWMHVPWTNGIMLFAALRIIHKITEIREGSPTAVPCPCCDFFQHCFRDPPIVPGNPDLNFRIPIHELGGGSQLDKAPCAAIVFPCLVLRDIETFNSSRAEHRASRDLVEWTFAKKMIQVERTLDEAYYPSLHAHVLEKRNRDQVVTRECTSLISGKSISGSSRPILTVPQFWIWKIGDSVLSAYSMPGKDMSAAQKPDYKDVPRNHPLSTAIPEVSTFGFEGYVRIGLSLANQIEQFGKTQARDSFPAPLDIFEVGVVRVMSSVDEYMAPDNTETPEIKKEREFMHDISDIRSELVMVDGILLEQERILTSVIESCPTESRSCKGWPIVEDAKKLLETYRDKVKKIDRDAERIEKMIQDQLNLKRTFATIRDTRTSLLLGTAVIGFTIVTMIFAPIAFMATLFALPIDKIVTNQVKIGDTNVFETNYIGKWFVTAEIASLVVTGLAVWASVALLSGFKRARNDNTDAKVDAREGATDIQATRREKKATDDEQEGGEAEETKGPESNSTKFLKFPGLWKRSKKIKTEDV